MHLSPETLHGFSFPALFPSQTTPMPRLRPACTVVLAAALAAIAGPAGAQRLVIESLGGPVTQREIDAFKAFVAAQTPPAVPWANRHNAWSFGGGGRTLEALGLMCGTT